MNHVILIGRVTAKPELRYTNSSKPVTNFNIAINRRQGEENHADFIKIQAWNNTAENICIYLEKGSLIGIDGSLRTSKYEDKDGNKRIDTYVVANQVKFLEKKKEEKDETTRIEPSKSTVIEEDPFADFGDTVCIDDNFLD